LIHFTTFVSKRADMPDDRFSIVDLPFLTNLFLDQLEKGEVFGIPVEMFFTPLSNDPSRIKHFGQPLETTIGVAAGPHTQLAQNIVIAWLCGARYMELKTIQTLDELDVSKPCIDMQDQGYNCEWSQELKIQESYDQYLNAWILIHLLKHKLGFLVNTDLGTIFNMSVGYDYQGIMQDNVQWFLDKMQDCSKEKSLKISELESIYPEINEIIIPDRISDNVTLSTMHGCPSDEIEKIGLYLIKEKKLHTSIKLNPTLLGAESLRGILNNNLGFTTVIPDSAFEHDLKYDEAIGIIKNLSKAAKDNLVHFSLKLSNTLECLNNKDIFTDNEMYMSGRALHPLTVSLAAKLQRDFQGQLNISFAGGADCFNIADLLTCNLQPVTICTDLLKPGGYGRLQQYIKNISDLFNQQYASSIDELILSHAGNDSKSIHEAALQNLEQYSKKVLEQPQYKNTHFHTPNIKTERPLNTFDCIHAPCIDTCPTHQDIPNYIYHTLQGEIEYAFDTILDTNPFLSVTGMVCDHLCQLKCTRIHYDDALLIREIKRFVAENYTMENIPFGLSSSYSKVGIIGAGPCGLTAAYYLSRIGFDVHVYEEKGKHGGMISSAIPSFRLTDESIQKDIKRITDTGATIHYDSKITVDFFEKLRRECMVIVIATGAQRSKKLKIQGFDAVGILDPLKFLFKVKSGIQINIGNEVVIIGGGNTAMDAARTAYRLVGKNGKVRIIYRRTKKEMPADIGEIKAVIEEGVEISELLSPIKINTENGEVNSITCQKMKLGEPDDSGRPRPIPVTGALIEINCDTVIPALGQDLAIDFVDHNLLETQPDSYQTQIPGVYIGGDALRGASTAINAIGDGRKIYEEILNEAVPGPSKKFSNHKDIPIKDIKLKRYQRMPGIQPVETGLDQRKNFNLVVSSLTKEQVIQEASRCLFCDELCNVCVSVCPNLANWSYEIEPVYIDLKKIVKNGNGYILEADDPFIIEQKHQVLNIGDWCNECGNCTTFCPSEGSPYKDKPRLYLTRNGFDESEAGYFTEKDGTNIQIHYKDKDETSCLIFDGEGYFYEDEHVSLNLTKDFVIEEFNILKNELKEIKLTHIAEMRVLLEYVKFY